MTQETQQLESLALLEPLPAASEQEWPEYSSPERQEALLKLFPDLYGHLQAENSQKSTSKPSIPQTPQHQTKEK